MIRSIDRLYLSALWDEKEKKERLIARQSYRWNQDILRKLIELGYSVEAYQTKEWNRKLQQWVPVSTFRIKAEPTGIESIVNRIQSGGYPPILDREDFEFISAFDTDRNNIYSSVSGRPVFYFSQLLELIGADKKIGKVVTCAVDPKKNSKTYFEVGYEPRIKARDRLRRMKYNVGIR